MAKADDAAVDITSAPPSNAGVPWVRIREFEVRVERSGVRVDGSGVEVER